MATIDANPYRWPWDGDLSADRLVLVVAGAQRYWLDRTIGAELCLDAVALLANRLRSAGVPVLWVRHGRLPASRTSIPEHRTDPWALAVTPDDGDIIIDAAGLDGCYGSPLHATLRTMRRDRVVLCGLGLEGPVHSTLRSLNDRGFECLTLTDACAPYDIVSASAALSTITFSFGIFGAIAPSASLLGAFPAEVVAS